MLVCGAVGQAVRTMLLASSRYHHGRQRDCSSRTHLLLGQVLQDPSLAVDPNLRPEQFTLQREALRREQAAEIITVDQDYDTGAGGGYKPKVATWGTLMHVC